MSKPKIYISGPITGYKDGNKREFIAAEKKLKKLGYKPINPQRLVKPTEDLKGNLYDFPALKKSLHLMLKTNNIFFLKGWDKSLGCKMEYELAKNLKYNIYYQEKKYGSELQQL